MTLIQLLTRVSFPLRIESTFKPPFAGSIHERAPEISS